MIIYTFEPIRVDLDETYIAEQFVEFGGKMQTVIRRGMRNTPKTGRRYRRGGKTHIASSPGNYPAIDTGRLFGSISFDAKPRSVQVGALASSGVNYSKYVDPKRPFLERGLLDTMQRNPDFMSDYITVRTE